MMDAIQKAAPVTNRITIKETVGRLLRNFFQRDQGVAAIEFAIIGGVFSMVLVVSGDLGLAYYSNMQVQTSAQVGAEYAAIHGFNAPAISNAVVNATSTAGINASPDPIQFFGCPSAGGIAAAASGSTCPDGTMAATYVRASASRSYTTLIPYPGVPATYAQTATSTVRIK